MFRKFVFKNYWSFCSAEFTLLFLFTEFLIAALFVIYSNPSMFAENPLHSFSSVILSKKIHCLYTFANWIFVSKVIYQDSFFFIKLSRIRFIVYLKVFTIYSIYHLRLFLKRIFVIIFRFNSLFYWDSPF